MILFIPVLVPVQVPGTCTTAAQKEFHVLSTNNKLGTTMEKSNSSTNLPVGRSDERIRPSILIRSEDEVRAMGWGERVRARLKRLTGIGNNVPKKTEQENDYLSNTFSQDNEKQKQKFGDQQSSSGELRKSEQIKKVQYRFEPPQSTSSTSVYRRIITLNGLLDGPDSSQFDINSFNSSWLGRTGSLSYYLHCIFRANPVILFVAMSMSFFGLAFFFSILILIAGTVDPECVRVAGEPFNSHDTAFADAFALSWVTFSTVGYGTSYPALGYQNDNFLNCMVINIICALESLVGVLYSGFCGAILFGKILRMQSHAQVIFSDPVVIRYGRQAIYDTNSHDSNDATEDQRQCPFPVLEFRIVNRLFKEEGGEIMDCALTVVANVDEHDLDERKDNFSSDGSVSRQEILSFTNGNTRTESQHNDTEFDESKRSFSSSRLLRNLFSKQRRESTQSFTGTSDEVNQQQHLAHDEDLSSRFVTKHLFSRMSIEAGEHPFFKRVWIARHILNGSSPLLSSKVRRKIRKNGNVWPESLNSAQAIRDALHFNQILVSLNGISIVSASDVYAQKIYDYVDVNIGYQFVNILYMGSDGTIEVDMDLINDIREQHGGGGEPFFS